MKQFWINKVAQVLFNEEDEMNMIETSSAIRVSTMELYDNFFDSIKDSIWSEPNHPNCDEFLKIARGIASANACTIRNAFSDGYTPMLIGNKMIDLESMENKEIRVYHKHKNDIKETLICVVIDREISY